MTHTHTWSLTHYVLLSLPRQGLAERVVSYRCTGCPLVQTLDGEMHLSLPLSRPEAIEAAASHMTTRASREARQLLRTQR